MSVEGVGAGGAWWFEGPHLYTSTRYHQQATQLSFVTVRVSDGGLFRDYVAVVEWRPDPFGGPEYSPVGDDQTYQASYMADSGISPSSEFYSPWGI